MRIDNIMFLMIIKATPPWIYRYGKAELGQIAKQYQNGDSDTIRRVCVVMPKRPGSSFAEVFYIEYHDAQFLIHGDGPIGTRRALATVPTCEPDFDQVVWQTLIALWKRGDG